MLVTLIASIISGTVLVSLTHPLDVMATRLYNQGIYFFKQISVIDVSKIL